MKHLGFLSFILFAVFSFSFSSAQTFELELNAVMKKNNGEWKKNNEVVIRKFVHETVYVHEVGEYKDKFWLEDDKGTKVEINSKVDDCFRFKYNNIQDLWDASIITNVLYSLKKKGFQYDLRDEMEDDALEYIQRVRNAGLELNDPYLKTYIYSLVAKIAPMQLIDGRPGSVNILIQENPSINACCFSNGTIVLNTGLLASLHTEDELVAILAHEIAHFILDHSVQNVNAAISRKKRAEFWAGLATGLTAIAEGVAASKNPYYKPGAATLGMAIISSNIASEVIDRLGMNYSDEQEQEADLLAIKALMILGYDPLALASALSRLKTEYVKERSNVEYLSSYTHSALMNRIATAGSSVDKRDKVFEQMISFAVSSVAMMKYSDCRFRQCIPYVRQNIENGVATIDDYILMANCLLSTKNDEESNNEAIRLIEKAKSFNVSDINLNKVEILATLRIGEKTKAMEQIKHYINLLDSCNLSAVNGAKTWESLNGFVVTEKDWANKMLIKLSGM